MASSVVIRVKRGRDEMAMDDFVLREEATVDAELHARMTRIRLADDGADAAAAAAAAAVAVVPRPRARVFRRVGTVSAAEADRLVLDPTALEAQVRVSVKEASLRGLGEQRAAQGAQAVRVSRLRVLQDKRMGNQRVLDVGSGRTKRDRDGAPVADATRAETTALLSVGDAGDEVLCNGRALKRVDLSLAAEDVVDLFVEAEAGDTVDSAPWEALGGAPSMHELWLAPFGEDSDAELEPGDADEDPDGLEIDYGSSTSEPSSRDEFGDGWRTLRDSEDADDPDAEYDPYADPDDEDNLRFHDRSMHLEYPDDDDE